LVELQCTATAYTHNKLLQQLLPNTAVYHDTICSCPAWQTRQTLPLRLKQLLYNIGKSLHKFGPQYLKIYAILQSNTTLYCIKYISKWYLENNVNCMFRLSFLSHLQVVNVGYFNIQLILLLRRLFDKCCLQSNIFINIRHIWIKPVLCSRMVSLSHHTWPWTHRCLQPSHSAHRNGSVFRRSVQTACCYWILNREKSSSNWNSQTNVNRLWRSVCWCEYSKALGKEKCAVGKWFVVISVLMWVQ